MGRGIDYPDMPPEDYNYLVLAAQYGEPSIATAYLTAGADQPGFVFDKGFDNPWQKHLAIGEQTTRIIIGGFGAGKTRATLMALLFWALVANDFRAIYAAPTNGQARAGFDTLLNIIRNSKLDPYVHDARQPVMELIFHYTRPDGVRHQASIIFVNAEKGGVRHLSREVDIVALDEAFTLSPEDFQDAVQNLGSRARGVRRTGKPRLGIFMIVTNPFDNPAGWYFVDLMKDNPDAWVRVVTTFENKNLTNKQIADIMRRVPPEKREQFLLGKRVAAYGGFFPEQAVIDAAIEFPRDRFLEYRTEKTTGTYAYRLPRQDADTVRSRGIIYVTCIDLGTGRAPFRNAPVVLTVEIDPEDRMATVASFWWGDGGDIQYMMQRIAEDITTYGSQYVYIDATGPQRGTYMLIRDEMLGRGIDTNFVGVDFAKTKSAMLYQLRAVLEKHMLRYEKSASGIQQQLLAYKLDDKKLSQDIVMSLAMAAPSIWNVLGPLMPTASSDQEANQDEPIISVWDFLERRIYAHLPRAMETRPGGRPVLSAQQTGRPRS